jgi:hypothetical protein
VFTFFTLCRLSWPKFVFAHGNPHLRAHDVVAHRQDWPTAGSQRQAHAAVTLARSAPVRDGTAPPLVCPGKRRNEFLSPNLRISISLSNPTQHSAIDLPLSQVTHAHGKVSHAPSIFNLAHPRPREIDGEKRWETNPEPER